MKISKFQSAQGYVIFKKILHRGSLPNLDSVYIDGQTTKRSLRNGKSISKKQSTLSLPAM